MLHLADEGIGARVLGQPLQGAYAGIELGGMHLPEVWVAEKDRQAAEPLIDGWRAEHSPANVSDAFQFPLGLIFMAMAYVAVVLGFRKMDAFNQLVFGTLIYLAIFALVGFVAWKKLRSRRIVSEET